MSIPKRTLGNTGVQVTALGLGGVCWCLADTDEEAVRVVHRAIDRGITYIDTASTYKNSEQRLGLALKERDRSKLFIATKCIKRRGDEARRELEQSFQRLGLEVIDLVQLHALDQDKSAHPMEDVLAADGMLRLLEEYRAAGRVRFVGLTGHMHPARFTRMIGEYDFDTLLNPAGPLNTVWNDFTRTSLAAARSRGMGVIGMKVMAYGQAPAADRALYLRYAMSRDVDVAIVGMDTVKHVDENVAVAEAYAPLSAEEERALLRRALDLIPRKKKELWWLPGERVTT